MSKLCSPCKGCTDKVFRMDGNKVIEDCRKTCEKYLEFEKKLDVQRAQKAEYQKKSDALSDFYKVRRKRTDRLVKELMRRGRK